MINREYEKKLFTQFLALAAGDDHVKKEDAIRTVRQYESEAGAQFYATHEGSDVKVRELLQTTAVESTTLVQTQFHRLLIQAADDVKSARNVLPVYYNGKGPTARFVVRGATTGTTGSTYVDEVTEGADIPLTRQNYGYVDATYKKIALRPGITNELINDGLFDVVAEEGQYTAKLLENQLNQDVYNSLADNAGTETDTTHGGTAAHTGMDGIACLRSDVAKYGFMPNKFVMHAEFEKELLEQMVPTNYFGAAEITANGSIGRLLGMDLYFWNGASSGSQTWGYAADGEIGALALDSSAAGAIKFAWDLSMEKYDDPVKDLVGMKVSMRYATSYTNAYAISRLEY